MHRIDVVYASDDNFAQHLAVSIASLLYHSRERNIQIVISILNGGISQENRSKIVALEALNERSSIHFITMDISDFENFPLHTGKHSIATYFRLVLPSLLHHVDKVIYLDCDTIVTSDISTLWNVGMDGYPLLAVEEPYPLNFHRLKLLGMDRSAPYFNAGVLVLDLAWMRANHSEKKFQEIIEKQWADLLYQDQDVLNIHFFRLWKPIHLKYNAFYYVNQYKYRECYRSYPRFWVDEARKNPVIVHFNQYPKPWENACLDPRKRLYEHYIKMTPFSDFRTPHIIGTAFLTYLKKKYLFMLENRAPWLFYALRRIKWMIEGRSWNESES